jgi:hypothetical protein
VFKHRRRLIIAAGCAVIVWAGAWQLAGASTEQIDSFADCAQAGYAITDTNPPACDADSHFFLGPKATPAPPLPAATSVQFWILVDGDTGQTYPQTDQVIATSSEWQTYWSKVHAGLPTLPPILPVNFTTNQTVAISEGPMPTTGYNLEITSIMTSATGTTVYVTEQIPTVTCKVSNTRSDRYFIVETTKLATPVSFVTTANHRQCNPVTGQ